MSIFTRKCFYHNILINILYQKYIYIIYKDVLRRPKATKEHYILQSASGGRPDRYGSISINDIRNSIIYSKS